MARRRRRNYILFTHGKYVKNDLPFYKGLAKGKVTVAVDGGLRFFRLTRTQPDILVGDFDSISKPRHLPRSVEVIEYPSAKDKTDTHLAIDLAIQRGATSVDIVMPSLGEPDHLLGTILLPFLKEAAKISLRIVSHDFEIHSLIDGAVTITNGQGDLVSVVPISARGVYSCTGVEFPVKGAALRLGDSLALRNCITARRARFEVVGKAWLVRNFAGG